MPDFDSPHVPPTDRRRSRDPADHLGFNVQSIALWRRRGHLVEFEADELLSIAFIEAEHLLRVKYDPTRATVTSFLSGWLFGRVQYAAPPHPRTPPPAGAEGGVHTKRVTGVEPATFSLEG